jgi:putative aldouronate transport system permease protein
MKEDKTGKERIAEYLYYVLRISVLLSVVMMFFPGINPAKICDYVNKNMSLFTSGISYQTLISECGRAFSQGWVQESSFSLLFFSSMVTCIGIVLCAVTGCMSLGNLKMKKTGNWFSMGGSVLQMAGLSGIYIAYTQVAATARPERVSPNFESGNWCLFFAVAALVLATTVVIQFLLPKPEADAVFEMESKFKLFLMFLPFAALSFVFGYLPLLGWRYSFYDYVVGGTLSADKFVGFKWFTSLFENQATRGDMLRVIRNTLAMSGLGLATSWCAMAFAIFMAEIKNLRLRRFIQTFTTIPNFVSWVLVYAIAFAIFSTDGFVSSFFVNAGIWGQPVNMLMGESSIWLKMLAWGMWKGLGWSAIIYIAAISGIDQQLYEAATVDGAGRFQKMWHITVPGLIPTFMVLLLLAVAGILNNGMEQYLVFKNAVNADLITVLDLHVYNLGINNGAISLSTVVGMMKSIISVALLFSANGISKMFRGESIV